MTTDPPNSEDQQPLKFPCRFPIKVMGAACDDFGAQVCALVRPHAPDVSENDLTYRPSRGGRYVSVTITVTAHSRAQLDAIYQALTAWEGSSFVL